MRAAGVGADIAAGITQDAGEQPVELTVELNVRVSLG